MARHNQLGTIGEQAAVDFLKANGHNVLERNYRCGKAEVDIVSQDGKFIVFSEVKTRSNQAFGLPEEFVDKKKRLLMKKAADGYMQQQNRDNEIRFDVISVTHDKGKLTVYHIKDAFFHEEDNAYN